MTPLLLLLAMPSIWWVNAPPGSAPAAQPAPLDELLEPIRARHKLPALAGAIVRGSDVVAAGAVGVRRTGSPEKLTLDDRFHLGSCGKAMTATLLARLVEEGTLTWTTTVADAFPDLRETMHADWRGVTLEQLLTHTAGAPADLQKDPLWAKLWKREGTPAQQRHMLLEGVIAKPPEGKPGSKYAYSNAGYAIAGVMAERATNAVYEDLMREMIFEPLGMKSAGFGPPGVANEVSEPRGHRLESGKPVPVEPGETADNPPAIAPAGTMHATIGDWAKFVALHITPASGNAALLKSKAMKKLHTPASKEGYAMGWNVMDRPWGGKVLQHAGSNTMWFCVVWASPEKKFAVLVATNLGDESAYQALDDASGALIQHYTKHFAKSGK